MIREGKETYPNRKAMKRHEGAEPVSERMSEGDMKKMMKRNKPAKPKKPSWL
jgi:hypothetical protein